jgi:spermidine dehydrogenase
MESDDHSKANDTDLGMRCPISRRDFLNGVAVGVGGALAGSLLPALPWTAEAATQLSQDAPGYDPPALTGMRGSHPGSFEIAHSVRDGAFFTHAGNISQTGESYDLVVVGGGISGLAAAYFYRKLAGNSARILILDNHDDFGGHAKRNEFRPGGRLLLANGGTLSIESPFPYSTVAHQLLSDLGIDPPALEAKCVDRSVYRGLKQAVFFDKETFGVDRLVVGRPGGRRAGGDPAAAWNEFLLKTPLSPEAQSDIVRIQTAAVDYMPGLSQSEKKDRLTRMSYKDFLLNVVKAHPASIPYYQTDTHGLYGIGIDAVPALDCWAIGFPGFQGMGLDRTPNGGRLSFTALGAVTPEKSEYTFHFPDGNASIARMLVRSLIPAAIPGHTAEDIVTAGTDYSKLDSSSSPIKIRLSSTVVRVRHLGDPASAKEVEITYATPQGKLSAVRGKAVVMACWNMVTPYLCPELPEKQKEALKYGSKVPLVYTVVALRNWSSFSKLGIQRVATPGMYHTSIGLDSPVSIGAYECPKKPEDPILVRMLRTPCHPGEDAREQQRAGRYDLLSTSFETFERNIRDQLQRVLGPGGFDAARDIDGITVNRWPHGYAYEYNPLWDPEWPAGESPCEIGRKQFGRITIANSDAAAAAYTDQAIDQGYRAIQEISAYEAKSHAAALEPQRPLGNEGPLVTRSS